MSEPKRLSDAFPAPLTLLRTHHNRPTLDPLYVADLYRRHAYQDQDAEAARDINQAIYFFGASMSWLGNEMPFGHSTHKQTEINMAKHLTTLAALAEESGAKDILLPLKDKTPLTTYLKKVIKAQGVPGNFIFRDKTYATDLTCAGKQDLKIKKNILYTDHGLGTLRGYWFINENLKDKWDRENAPNPAVRPVCKPKTPGPV